MTKAVLRALVLTVLALAGVLSVKLAKDWGHNTHLSLRQGILVCLPILVVGNILLYLLEKKRALALNWWWHRIWYVRELKSHLEKQWAQHFSLPNPPDSIIEVLVKESRVDLVSFLFTALKTQRKDRVRVLVLGERGAGKSTAMEKLAWELARASRWWPGVPMPVLCRMGNFTAGTLVEFATREIASMTPGESGTVLSAGLAKLLQRRRIVLLLDAVDEVPEAQRNELATALDDLTKPAWGDPPVIITARTLDPQEALLSRKADHRVVEVQDLSDRAVDHLIARHLGGSPAPLQVQEIHSRLDSHELLGRGGLARNPFWLPLILRGRVFEKNQVQILDAAVKELLQDELSKPSEGRTWTRLQDPSEQIYQTRRSYEWLANQMTSNGSATICLDEAVTGLKAMLESTGLSPNDVLNLGRETLLIEFAFDGLSAKPPDIRFHHPLLQHFFAGSALHSKPELLTENVFQSLAVDDRWWDALVVLNEIFDAGSGYDYRRHAALVSSVLGQGGDGRRVILAAGLLWSIDKLIDEVLVQEVKSHLLARCGQGHVDAGLSSGAHTLVKVAPELLVKALELIAEEPGPVTPSAISLLLRDVMSQYLERPSTNRFLRTLFNSLTLREQAKKVLIQIGEAAVEPVLTTVAERTPAVVIDVLGDLQSPKAVERLLDVLERAKDDFEKANIAVALGKIGDERAIPLLSVLAHEDKLWVHGPAIEALGRVGAVGTLIELFELPNGGGFQRFSTVDALAEIGKDAVPELTAALENSNPDVRSGAIEVLAKIGDKTAAGPIAACLSDQDGLVIMRAVEALGKTGPGGIEPLLAFVAKYREPNLFTSKAADSLASLGPAAVSALLEASRHPNGVVRAVAADALGVIGDNAAFDRLREMLVQDDDTQVRYAAAVALGNLGDRRAIPLLQRSGQGDRYLLAQIGATLALAKLQVPGSVDWLLQRLDAGFDGISDERNDDFRFLAGKALTELGERRAIPGLGKLATNPAHADSCRHFIKQLSPQLSQQSG